MFDLKSIKTRNAEDPKDYILEDEGLTSAVQMAIWLGKPLLLTGAPGTGKTRLAYKLANMLSTEKNDNLESCATFLEEPLVFNTKTTSTATELFYSYDAIRHFQKRYVEESKSTEQKATVIKADTDDEKSITTRISSAEATSRSRELSTAHSFIKLNALGKAIVQAYGSRAIINNDNLNELQYLQEFDKIESEPRSSVVLVDEIDKAPRDFPNDLLNEMENMEFYISELMNKRIPKPDSNARVLIIITSNFEKNLPDAFLRRCLFYHIASPSSEELVKILSKRLESHLKELYKGDEKQVSHLLSSLPYNINAAVTEFDEVKKIVKQKQPATAELLDWVKSLEQKGFFNESVDFSKLRPEKKKVLRELASALAKDDTDLENLKKRYE